MVLDCVAVPLLGALVPDWVVVGVVLFDGSLVCAQATAPKLTVVASARIMILIFASCASPQANNAFVR